MHSTHQVRCVFEIPMTHPKRYVLEKIDELLDVWETLEHCFAAAKLPRASRAPAAFPATCGRRNPSRGCSAWPPRQSVLHRRSGCCASVGLLCPTAPGVLWMEQTRRRAVALNCIVMTQTNRTSQVQRKNLTVSWTGRSLNEQKIPSPYAKKMPYLGKNRVDNGRNRSLLASLDHRPSVQSVKKIRFSISQCLTSFDPRTNCGRP